MGDRLVTDVLELDDQVTPQFLVDDRHGDGVGLVLEEVAIVCCLELNLEVCREEEGERRKLTRFPVPRPSTTERELTLVGRNTTYTYPRWSHTGPGSSSLPSGESQSGIRGPGPRGSRGLC